jgi:4-amino-4-deoxy-L-arabinose transferase-like glycosyltransferase
MEQVGSSASDDQCPLTTTPRNSPWGQGRLTSESAVPPPTPRAVSAGQAPNQQAQAQTDGYGTGGGNGWLTRSVNLLEERGDRVMLAVCAMLAVASGVVAVHEGSTLKFDDESQYTAIADNLVSHGTFSLTGQGPTAYRPPVWPMFLALLRLLGAGVVTMRVANVLILTITVFVLYRVVAGWTRPLVGILAGLLVAGCPLMVYTATTLYPQTLAGLLLVVVLWLVRRNGRHPILDLAGAGVVFGLLVLDVTTFIYLLPFLPLFRPSRTSLYLRGLTLLTAGTVLIVGLWSVRNVLEFHHLFFVSTNSGVNLLLGNSPHAGADTGVSADIAQYTEHARLLSGEVAQNAYYQQEAISWIVHNPGRAAELYALKFLNFFNSSNQLATAGVGSGSQGAVLTAYYALLWVLLVARLALWRRLPWKSLTSWCLAMYFVGALVSAVFFTRVRLQGPFDLLLIIALAPLAGILISPRRQSEPAGLEGSRVRRMWHRAPTRADSLVSPPVRPATSP